MAAVYQELLGDHAPDCVVEPPTHDRGHQLDHTHVVFGQRRVSVVSGGDRRCNGRGHGAGGLVPPVSASVRGLEVGSTLGPLRSIAPAPAAKPTETSTAVGPREQELVLKHGIQLANLGVAPVIEDTKVRLPSLPLDGQGPPRLDIARGEAPAPRGG